MDTPRLAMVDELVRSRGLLGMSRSEVETLLGQPTETAKWKDWDLVYWLGPERSYIRIDSEWLVLKFDANKNVATVRIVKD